MESQPTRAMENFGPPGTSWLVIPGDDRANPRMDGSGAAAAGYCFSGTAVVRSDFRWRMDWRIRDSGPGPNGTREWSGRVLAADEVAPGTSDDEPGSAHGRTRPVGKEQAARRHRDRGWAGGVTRGRKPEGHGGDECPESGHGHDTHNTPHPPLCVQIWSVCARTHP